MNETGECFYIPLENRQTAVLLGLPRSNYARGAYAVRIGFADIYHPLQKNRVDFEDSYRFQNWQMELMNSEGSIFDRTHFIRTARVQLSPAALFANGTDILFSSLNLSSVLRTVLPETDGSVSVLQYMVQKHGQTIGLATIPAMERYTRHIYDLIGQPITNEKKGNAK